jgi:hypothetical protein
VGAGIVISGLRLTQIALMMLPAGKPQKEGNSRGPAYGDNIKDLRRSSRRRSVQVFCMFTRRILLYAGLL